MRQTGVIRPDCFHAACSGAPDPEVPAERPARKKIFVLDTNVLIHDPDCLFRFGEHDVVIPFVVLKDLDRLRKGPGEIAASARTVLRIIDRF